MLDTGVVRQLMVGGPDAPGTSGAGCPVVHLSAASGLVRLGQQIYVVADDELHAAQFDLDDPAPGRWLRLFDGTLPTGNKARKAAKPDLESLTWLPAFPGHTHGALLALGSASRPSREHAALVPLGPHGERQGPVLVISTTQLLAPLREHFGDLNIEGCFILGLMLCLLQRGHQARPVNACVQFVWAEVAAWLLGEGPVPRPRGVRAYNLGHVDKVALCFTDGAALADGRWVFCAAAESTDDSYHDGQCVGAAVGVVSAAGDLETLLPLRRVCKPEGIAATLRGAAIDLLLVTDADDRCAPALLLAATLP